MCRVSYAVCPQLSAVFTSAEHVMVFMCIHFDAVYELMRKKQFLGHTFTQISIHQRIYEDFIHYEVILEMVE